MAAAAAVALSGIDFLTFLGILSAFLCAPLFFVVPGASLLLLRREEELLPADATAPGEGLPPAAVLFL